MRGSKVRNAVENQYKKIEGEFVIFQKALEWVPLGKITFINDIFV